MTIPIGLIGAGRMGQVHARVLVQSVEEVSLVAVADPIEANLALVAKMGVKDAYPDYRRLLERPDIQAVVIASPTATHVEVVKAAAAAGKQIFTEKPLSNTIAGCDEAIAAVKAAGVRLMVGFMRRYDRAYVAAKQKIEEGVIGEPVMYKGVGRDPRRTSLEFARRSNSGGMILDMGVHEFDLARWLMGSEVTRVYSEGDCLVYPEVGEVGDIDNALINLRFDNKTLGNVDLSRNAVYGYDIRTEILGSRGGLVMEMDRQTGLLVMTQDGVTHDTVPYFMERFGEAYAAEIRDFVACLVTGKEPRVSSQDARAATAIGLAATLSLDEGRPVNVAEVG